MPSKNEKLRISLGQNDKVSVCVTSPTPPVVASPPASSGDPSTNPGGVYLSHKNPVSRSTSNRSSVPGVRPSTLSEKQKKGKKLGHRRVRNDGEVTYKKFETTQLIGSIQLGIQHSVGSLANLDPNRDLLMLVNMPIHVV